MKILVIGDSCLDVFIYGECNRLCPEAPVPVFNPVSKTTNIGMAGNVAANLTALGAEVTLITNEETIIKTRYVDKKSNHIIIRIDENDKVKNSFDIKSIDFSKKYDAIVVSDYNKGFLNEVDLISISKLHPLTFLDTKKKIKHWSDNFSFIKINESEWINSGKPKNKNLIVTLGERGCMYNKMEIPPLTIRKIMDVSGAGDSFLAGLVYKYVLSKDIYSSLVTANHYAGKAVEEVGISVVDKIY